MSLTRHINEIQKIFEMPWVSIGDTTIDLELEKHNNNREEVIDHIKTLIGQYGVSDRELFIDYLFSTYPVVMSNVGVTKQDLMEAVNEATPSKKSLFKKASDANLAARPVAKRYMYYFPITLSAEGTDPDDAWADAVDNFNQDPRSWDSYTTEDVPE